MSVLTSHMTVDTLGEDILADADCDVLTIREHGAAGTTEWDLYMPDTSTGVAVRLAAGEAYTFTRPQGGARISKNRKLGTAKTVSGSVTFDKFHQ